jgi:hypothetical protein
MKPNRKSLKTKMFNALCQEISTLPKGTQKILIDDLITAFENRLAVFNKKQASFEMEVITGLEVSQ